MNKLPINDNPDFSSGVIVHDDFVSINGLQRCGTTSTRSYIIDAFNQGLITGNLDQYVARFHMPVRLCSKQDLNNKKIIGNIRNPFSFYVSYIDYHKNAGPDDQFLVAGWADLKHLNFKQLLYILLFKLDWPNFVNNLDGYRYKNSQKWKYNQSLQVGLYTKRYINMFFNNGNEILNSWSTRQFFDNHDKELTVTNIVKLENFKNDIDDALSIEKSGVMPYENMSSFNPSSLSLQEVLAERYDEESISWVKTRDKIFFDKYYKE